MPQEKWITVNGAHIPLDKEGEPTGKVGKKIAEKVADTPSRPYSADLEEQGGDHKKAAHAFYRRELQGKTLTTNMGERLGQREVHFTGGGWQELKEHMKDDPVKAELVPAIPNILLTGAHREEDPLGNHPDVHKFHVYTKDVVTSVGKKRVLVDVAERPKNKPETSLYSLTREGTYEYAKRVGKGEGKSDDSTIDAGQNLRTVEPSDKCLDENLPPAFEVVNIRIEEKAMKTTDSAITFDAASQRRTDENGFLHVAVSHISKECINPYRGEEIPGWQERGLDPEKIYMGYRKGEELEKAAATFNGLPLLRDHHPESAENPQKEHRIGTLGTEAAWRAPYLDNSLVFTDAVAIAEIEAGSRTELSCSYRYVPVWEPGVFDGEKYDFVMTDIRGNHCALVVEGRAGPDVLVADATINPIRSACMKSKQFFQRLARMVLARDAAPGEAVEAKEVEAAAEIIEGAQEILSLHKGGELGNPADTAAPMAGDEDKEKKIKELLAGLAGKLSPEELKQLEEGLTALAYSSPTGDSEAEKAADADPDPACGKDEEPDAPKGEDEEPEPKKAVDEDGIAKTASDRALQRFQSILDAQHAVRPHVGEIRVNLAKDSAADVYGAALDAMSVNKRQYPREAWRSVFQALTRQMSTHSAALAADAALPKDSPLARIKVMG